ncbi:MAG: RNA-directed DNA polymerase [Actinobacteria bacterium]|nr:RNA-directed DNA polymerase [Actinomycetota bacterium]
MPEVEPLGLEEVFTLLKLKAVWKRYRESARNELIRDPVDNLAYQMNLDGNLSQLIYRLQNGHYVTSSCTVIRGAKKDGLTRPLSFLELEDQLVLKAICDSLEKSVHAGSGGTVFFSRDQLTAFPVDESDYQTWFERWSPYHALIAEISDSFPFVVYADIASFFWSVDHVQLRQRLSECVTIRPELENLLFYVLDSMLAHNGYRHHSGRGLPQESHDASRILAHGFLVPVDAAFDKEQQENRYARWMDDFLIGVSTENEGKKALARFQAVLECRGLHPNAKKSRVVPQAKLIASQYREENQYLNGVNELSKAGHTFSAEETKEFEGRLQLFLDSPVRLENWNRVLRRYYTYSKWLGSLALAPKAFNHICEFPSDAGQILKYLNSIAFKASRLDELLDYLRSPDNLYDDVEIRMYDALLEWAVPYDRATGDIICTHVSDHLFARNGFAEPRTAYARAQCMLALSKFGTKDHIAPILPLYEDALDIDFIKYCYLVLRGSEYFADAAKSKIVLVEDASVRRLHAFVEAVVDAGSDDAKLRSSQFLRSRKRRLPNREYYDSRSLCLLRIMRRSNWYRDEIVPGLLKRELAKLRDSTPGPLQDGFSVHAMTNWSEAI